MLTVDFFCRKSLYCGTVNTGEDEMIDLVWQKVGNSGCYYWVVILLFVMSFPLPTIPPFFGDVINFRCCNVYIYIYIPKVQYIRNSLCMVCAMCCAWHGKDSIEYVICGLGFLNKILLSADYEYSTLIYFIRVVFFFLFKEIWHKRWKCVHL